MRIFLFLVSILALGAVGCGNNDGTGAGGTGGGSDALDLDIGPGDVRAGRLSEDQLPDDKDGLAVYKEGDFALVNENIALLIEDARASDLYAPFGGLTIGIARYSDGALVDAADYNEMGIGLRRFIVDADTVSVLNNGTDGNAAVVRAEGLLVAIPFLEDLLGGTAAGDLLLGGAPPEDSQFQTTRVLVDYELAPSAEHVDVYYTLDMDLAAAPVYLFFQSQRMPGYVPGLGFTSGEVDTMYDYMAFIDESAMSYAVEDPSGQMTATLAIASLLGVTDPEISGVLPLSGAEITFQTDQRHHIMRVHVGGNGIEGLRQAMARTNGDATRTITGTVRDSEGELAEGIRVHAETGAGEPEYITRVLTDASGAFSIDVPDGQDVQLRAYRRGDGITDPVAVAAGTSTADLTMPEKGTIHVVATDADTDEALPVRVQVIPDASGFQPPSNFGEPRVPFNDRLHVVFPETGDVTLDAIAGNSRVVVSRGYEYDLFDDDSVEVPVDDEVMVDAELTRVVDTSGVLCGDFHIHTTRSPDSPDAAEFKIISAAGDGVELPVRTDHEFVAAFEPVVEATGLTSWMYGLSSLELTTFSWGHFGVFPIEPDPSMPNDGAIGWNRVTEAGVVEVLEPVPVFNDARSRPGNPEVIMFHPRSPPGTGGGFAAIAGQQYFEGGNSFANTGGVGYDPLTDTITREGIDPATWWDTEFKTLEVFNDTSFEENKQNAGRIYGPEPADDFSDALGTVDDWFGLLNSAERDGVFAVGSSDSHSIMRGTAVGYPRTCLFVGTDDPETLRADADAPQTIKGLIQTGRAVISGGMYVTASGEGGEGPGQTISGDGPYLIDLEVQAPLWVGDVELIEMWTSASGLVTNTTIVENPDVDLDNGAVTRFSETVMVPDGVEWVIFHARGAFDPTIADRSEQAQTLAPVHPNRLPFGATNPIFLGP